MRMFRNAHRVLRKWGSWGYGGKCVMDLEVCEELGGCSREFSGREGWGILW